MAARLRMRTSSSSTLGLVSIRIGWCDMSFSIQSHQAFCPWPTLVRTQTDLSSSSAQQRLIGIVPVILLSFAYFITFLFAGWTASMSCLGRLSREWMWCGKWRFVLISQSINSHVQLTLHHFQAVGTETGKPKKKVVISDSGQI